MNDITYRPFIRDSALGDINIQIPNLEIPVYKPRYSQPLEDDTETEVQSQVEEIRNPEPIVQETTVHKFNSKKDFKDTMLPIYERLLKSKGLNPAFAKSLVAQDGLESAWGSKPAGSYNFGGIKGKGTTKRTREVINGKDVYINDQFRNFKSLEDYANFKIDLLNNKRYNAFSGDIKEFANRVHRGGYATDPRYANILNQVIASAKHGGVLKFQQGGIQEGKQWLEDWYKSRKGLVKQNVKQVLPIPLPVTESLLYAQLGLKIPKYQEPWNVLPDQMQLESFDPNKRYPLIETSSKQEYIPTIKDLANKFTSGFEAFKEFPYYLNGQELIGFGFADKNIINKYRKTGMSRSEGLKLLESELQKHWDALNKAFTVFKDLDPNVQLALTELSYNTHGINEFSEKRSPKLRKMLLDGITNPKLLIREINHDASKDNWTGVRSSGRRAMALGEYNWFPERVDKFGRSLVKDAKVGPKDWESSPYYKKY